MSPKGCLDQRTRSKRSEETEEIVLNGYSYSKNSHVRKTLNVSTGLWDVSM